MKDATGMPVSNYHPKLLERAKGGEGGLSRVLIVVLQFSLSLAWEKTPSLPFSLPAMKGKYQG